MAEWSWLAAGALLYHLSFVLDCVDGRIARLKDTGTILGGWLDYIFDRIRVFFCTLALMWGQYQATGQELFLILGVTVVFLDMLRYVDALQVAKVRRQMRSRLRKAMAESALADFSVPQVSDATETKSRTSRPAPDLPAQTPTHVDETADLQREFRTRFTRYMHLRDWLRRHRIRTHLVGGIEFQMAVFIIGPLTHHIAPVTIGTAALLLVFEAAITYKLWLSTRDLARALGQITPGPVGQTVAPHP
ncbi:CDP-alcohol phosphatidyltransferase family protein [Nonomuraea sp. NPDC003709]|uniref:CDP-alcohol phosphatidyltransferase family protein n=1 Tax=Nonomuraea sp. NPDC003709 TaxID=3154450 RepID=UPI0033BAF27F